MLWIWVSALAITLHIGLRHCSVFIRILQAATDYSAVEVTV